MMVEKALLDTDIFSEILKGVDEVVVARAVTYRNAVGQFTISTVTVMEIVKGLHKIQREDRVEQFITSLSTVHLLELDFQSSILAGRIYADLERTGQPIPLAVPIL